MKNEDIKLSLVKSLNCLTGEEGKIHKQCTFCNGFTDLIEFIHNKKGDRINKAFRRCLDRSREYHKRHVIMMQNKNIAEGE